MGKKMDRRAFGTLLAKGVGAMGASAAAMKVGLPALDELVGSAYDQEKIAEQEKQLGIIQSYFKQQVDGLLQLPETAIESMAHLIGEEILLWIVRNMVQPEDENGKVIRLGSSAWESVGDVFEEAKTNNKLLQDTLLAATREELVCRLPADVLGRIINEQFGTPGKLNWPVGIMNSLEFAYVHGYENKYEDSEGNSFIPLPQFISGMFYWYLTRTRGLPNAIVAHALHNLTYAKVMDFTEENEERLP